ncbi:MAG: molybdate ABC transporter substrate-binding protein [Tabrizicola sp.]|nr:molybdate ABC transporter substrate-binding protein [Tabrizicola sp.]
MTVIRTVLAVFLLALGAKAGATEITVFAASSLKTALDEVAADWSGETGTTVTIAYGGSAAMARQIEAGAPADIFLSAAPDWMDELQQKGLIRPETRRDLWGNRLVLIATGPDATPQILSPALDLAALLGEERLSMAMVDAVPAGQYGKEALQSLGLWDGIADRVVQSENVRQALSLVTLGEARFGVVYASDAVAEPEGISVIGTFPEDSHRPIVYPGAVTAAGRLPEAALFLDYLSSPNASAVFAGQGFTMRK